MPLSADGEHRRARSGERHHDYLPWAVVGLAIAFNLWILRAQTLPAANANDSSIHYSMVRWAEERIPRGAFTVRRLVPVPVDGGLAVPPLPVRRDERARAVLGVGLLSLLLFFGRPMLGPVLKLLPGSSDLYLRRFIMGVDLAGIYFAGIALATIGRWLYPRLTERRTALRPGAAVATLVLLAVVVLSPGRVRARFFEREGRGERPRPARRGRVCLRRSTTGGR